MDGYITVYLYQQDIILAELTICTICIVFIIVYLIYKEVIK